MTFEELPAFHSKIVIEPVVVSMRSGTSVLPEARRFTSLPGARGWVCDVDGMGLGSL